MVSPEIIMTVRKASRRCCIGNGVEAWYGPIGGHNHGRRNMVQVTNQFCITTESEGISRDACVAMMCAGHAIKQMSEARQPARKTMRGFVGSRKAMTDLDSTTP